MNNLRFYGGVFTVSAATLMLQLIQTRILSVIVWYHLAFFVISVSMFGLTAGAVWVYMRRDRFTGDALSYQLAKFSLVFAVSGAASLAIQMTLSPMGLPILTGTLVWLELAVCMSVPFFFAGVVVSLALTRSPFPVGRVYGVDLAGAATGCLGVLAVLDSTDGPTAVIWTSAIAALGGLLFAGSAVGTIPAGAEKTDNLFRRRRMIFGMLVLFAAVNGAGHWGLRPAAIKGRTEALTGTPMFEEWNSFSRVAVFRSPGKTPHMWGPSPRFDPNEWSIEQRHTNLDGDAGMTTYQSDGDIDKAQFLRLDVTNLAYYLPDRERAAVIGVGGGRDLLSARVFGVPEITGIEINPILVRLLTEESGHAGFAGLRDLDGISFVVDEARSWFARTRESFDIIQMSLIDTWAATGAGAFTLSENGLYTVEAWRIIRDRLTAQGVFTVSRWYAPGDINETGRLISLAMATAMDEGLANPRRHIFMVSSGRIATLVFSRAPFSREYVGRLEDAAARLGYDIVISPNAAPASDVLRNILAATDRVELVRRTSGLSLDLTPSTDDRPFFFNQLPITAPQKLMTVRTWPEGVASGNLTATITLMILFMISALLVTKTILVPLRPAIQDIGRKLAIGGTIYFLLIGVGFMTVEIGLLQRLSVFLGHPMYSLSVVLFSMILATGAGSLVSDFAPLSTGRAFTAWSLLAGGYLLVLPFWLPGVLLAYDGAGLLVRASLCVLVTAPAGLLMGYGFPTGMRLISAVDKRPTPWFWGINGAAGVLASSLAVACSIGFGISTTLIIGGVCYVLLIPAALSIGFGEAKRDVAIPTASELVTAR